MAHNEGLTASQRAAIAAEARMTASADKYVRCKIHSSLKCTTSRKISDFFDHLDKLDGGQLLKQPVRPVTEALERSSFIDQQ